MLQRPQTAVHREEHNLLGTSINWEFPACGASWCPPRRGPRGRRQETAWRLRAANSNPRVDTVCAIRPWDWAGWWTGAGPVHCWNFPGTPGTALAGSPPFHPHTTRWSENPVKFSSPFPSLPCTVDCQLNYSGTPQLMVQSMGNGNLVFFCSRKLREKKRGMTGEKSSAID